MTNAPQAADRRREAPLGQCQDFPRQPPLRDVEAAHDLQATDDGRLHRARHVAHPAEDAVDARADDEAIALGVEVADQLVRIAVAQGQRAEEVDEGELVERRAGALRGVLPPDEAIAWGVSATRVSPGAVSRGTAIFMGVW